MRWRLVVIDNETNEVVGPYEDFETDRELGMRLDMLRVSYELGDRLMHEPYKVVGTWIGWTRDGRPLDLWISRRP